MKRRRRTTELRMHATRRGIIFHYYMMYLLLSAMLLTTSGLCIHAILKADQSDVEIAAYLKTLRRLEGDFRNDAGGSVGVDLQDAGVQLSGSGEDTAVVFWSIQDNVVRRETLRAEERITSSRYVFAGGTKLNFTWQDQRLTLHVREAAVMPASQVDTELDTPITPARLVSIVTVIAVEAGDES